MKNTTENDIMKRPLPYLIAIMFVSACHNIESTSATSDELQSSYSAPVTVLLDTAHHQQRKFFCKQYLGLASYMCLNPVVAFIPSRAAMEKKILNSSHPLLLRQKVPFAHFTNFNTEQGLVLGSVLCSILDSKGRLWFGTGGGISRYDGSSFTNFTTEQGLASLSLEAYWKTKWQYVVWHRRRRRKSL
jgi:hypothetical protein